MDMTDSSLPGPSGKGIRTKLGCFTCRARKVKCDLTRPVCQTCTRLNLDCTYTKPDKQLNIPRLRRGRKRRTSDTTGSGIERRDDSVSISGLTDDRRGSSNTMPDLWGYQGFDPKPMTRMSLDYGHGHGPGYSSARGIPGMGMGEDGLASSAYLNSLLRPQPRRESMPVILPSNSNYSLGGYGHGNGPGIHGQGHGQGRQHQYRSPTPNTVQNLFNGYQIDQTGSGSGNTKANVNGTGNGCERDVPLPRSITPASSTQMTTPQGWDLATGPGGGAHDPNGPSGNGNGNGNYGLDTPNNIPWNQLQFDPFSTPSTSGQDHPSEYTAHPGPGEWSHTNPNSNPTSTILPGLNSLYSNPTPNLHSHSNTNGHGHIRSSSPFPLPTSSISHFNQSPIPNHGSSGRTQSLSLPHPHPQSQSQSRSSHPHFNSYQHTHPANIHTHWPTATPQGYSYTEEPKPYPPIMGTGTGTGTGLP